VNSSLTFRPCCALLVLGQACPVAILLVIGAVLSAATRSTLLWITQKRVYGMQYDITMVFGKLLRQPYEVYARENSACGD
jgi:hypothetical protein